MIVTVVMMVVLIAVQEAVEDDFKHQHLREN